MRPTRITGRLWLLKTAAGELYQDIDTDMIFHNRYLHITELEEMGAYTLDNLPGWEHFAQQAQPGDLIMAGDNFGAGSSRQQAVDCFRSLGIGAIIAGSFGAIYKRNAINSGLPVLTLPGVGELWPAFQSGIEITVDFKTGEILLNNGRIFHAEPFAQVQMEIYQAGNLFKYGSELALSN